MAPASTRSKPEHESKGLRLFPGPLAVSSAVPSFDLAGQAHASYIAATRALSAAAMLVGEVLVQLA